MSARAWMTGACVLALLGATQRLRAQTLSVGALASEVISTRTSASGTVRETGIGWGVEATGAARQFALDLRYLQAHVAQGADSGRDVAEGEIVARFMPIPWFGIGTGAHLRAFITPAGTERWVMWEGRARLQARLLGPAVRSYVEGWRALHGSVSGGTLDADAGMSVGLVVWPNEGRARARIEYEIDRGRLNGGAAEQVTEHLSVGVAIDLR